jgi:hypothetical protein
MSKSREKDGQSMLEKNFMVHACHVQVLYNKIWIFLQEWRLVGEQNVSLCHYCVTLWQKRTSWLELTPWSKGHTKSKQTNQISQQGKIVYYDADNVGMHGWKHDLGTHILFQGQRTTKTKVSSGGWMQDRSMTKFIVRIGSHRRETYTLMSSRFGLHRAEEM